VLLSQVVWELFSPLVQSRCRKLDVVTVKGSEFPIGIYTYDCNQNADFKDPKMSPSNRSTIMSPVPTGSTTPRQGSPGADETRPATLNASRSGGIKFSDPSDDAGDVFDEDCDLLDLRKHVTEEFLTAFNKGITGYLAGEWLVAKTALEESNELMKKVPGFSCDGPSATLLEYMNARDWKAPSDWAGFRPLTSK
jgi:hypothetical protein